MSKKNTASGRTNDDRDAVALKPRNCRPAMEEPEETRSTADMGVPVEAWGDTGEERMLNKIARRFRQVKIQREEQRRHPLILASIWPDVRPLDAAMHNAPINGDAVGIDLRCCTLEHYPIKVDRIIACKIWRKSARVLPDFTLFGNDSLIHFRWITLWSGERIESLGLHPYERDRIVKMQSRRLD